jgi:hypothetical protein
MILRLFQLLVLSGFSLIPTAVTAQKNIILNENLTANADQFKVKMGAQVFGKILKFHFGDYSILTGKMGLTTTTGKSNLTGTKTENKSSGKFYFKLGNGVDVATINAASHVDIKSVNEVQLYLSRGSNKEAELFISRGADEMTDHSDNFLALIQINQDTSDSWALLMKSTQDATVGTEFEGILTNHTRIINLSLASSYKPGENNRLLAAVGYQFEENGQYLAAVQYLGSGPFKLNKNIVWIDRELDQKLKMVLAAAMTAILQNKADMNE